VPTGKKKQIYNGMGSIHRARKGIVISGVDEPAFYTKNNTLFEKVLNFELWFFAFRFAFLALILYAKHYTL